MQSSQRSTIEATRPQQLLGLHVQRAGLVGLRVQREEAAHDLVGLGEDALVHALAEVGECRDPVAFASPRPRRSCRARQQRLQLAGAVQRHHVVVAADVGVPDEDLRHAGAPGARIISRAPPGSVSMRTSVQPRPLLLRKFFAATQYGQIAVL